MRLQTRFAQIWLVVLLGSVGGASLIPAGYMPGLNNRGHVALVLCSGATILTDSGSQAASPSNCWFAAMQPVALPTQPYPLAPVQARNQSVQRTLTRAIRLSQHRHLPRGPPHIS